MTSFEGGIYWWLHVKSDKSATQKAVTITCFVLVMQTPPFGGFFLKIKEQPATIIFENPAPVLIDRNSIYQNWSWVEIPIGNGSTEG